MEELDTTFNGTASLSTTSFSLALEQRLTLLIYHRSGVETVQLCEGQGVTIGRATPSDVRLSDAARLSRRHARFELRGGELVVEDLGSTNGTLVGGERITLKVVHPGEEVVLGSVVVGVHAPSPAEGVLQGMVGHDRFLGLVDEEIVRHRTFGRTFGLLLIQGKDPLSRWAQRLRPHVRPVDRMAVYSPAMVELLVPEATTESLRQLAETLVNTPDKGERALVCGGAVYPEGGTSPEELMEAAVSALQRARSRAPVCLAEPRRAPAAPPGETVIRSPAMRVVFDAVERLARTTIPVLLHGETGCGKEVVAQAIHQGGPRRDRPIRCVNCAAIPGELLESILFGHEKGAFTGADRRTDGVFVEAAGGTLLLDEIGDLPPPAQAALLRVLETSRVTRVGATDEVEVDVRIIAATHRDLEAMCDAGAFRWDLLYRINTMTLKIPPLRKRREEIEPLARMFLEEANSANDCHVQGFDDEALGLLRRYSWPGNVRELRNAVSRAVVMAQAATIAPADLPDRVVGRASNHDQEVRDEDETLSFKEQVQRLETRLITRALERSGGNQTEAARVLSLPIRTLSEKIKKYDIALPGRT